MIIPSEKRKLATYLLLILAFLIASIIVVGNVYLAGKITYIKKETQENLTSVAYLKVARIKTWWEERLGDATVIFNDKPMIQLVQRLLESGRVDTGDSATIEVLTWMGALQKSAGYENMLLLDTNGAVKLAASDVDNRVRPNLQNFISEAIRTKKIVATDLYPCEFQNHINIDIIIPLLATQDESARPIGLALLRINPNQFLYPLVQYWPTPSRTAETLLIRREGDYVLYLNELRHKKNTALLLRLPVSSKYLTDAIAAKGREGIVEGVDYRGVKVLSVVQKVPNTSWYLISKVDENEAYTPIRREVMRVSIVAFLLVIIVVVFVALLWNQQITKFYRIRYEIETRRIKVEDDLRRANEEWDRTFNAISDSIFILDNNHTLLKGNKAFFEMMGVSPEEVIGKNCYEVMHKLNKPWPECPFEKTKLDLKPHTEEVEDPEIGISLLVNTSPIFDAKGRLIGAVHISTDITARKKTEKELKEAKARLERTNLELRKLDQLKSDFISTVSHELRTPLAIIKEGINLVLDEIPGKINPKQGKILGVSSHNIDRLSRIINSLLDISKIEAGKVELKKAFFNMPDMIRQIAASFEPAIKQKGLELKLDVGSDDLKVYADSDRIAQVITNLVDNAMKFTDKGFIKISCNGAGDMVECSVADTGKGISKEDIPKVFDKFQQFGRIPGAGDKGTGLGLSIAKNIIDMHSGSMSVESIVGEGSKFTFQLRKYTPENLFKEYIDTAIKMAINNNLRVSIVTISYEIAKVAKEEISEKKLHEVMSDAAKLIKNTLRNKGDEIVRDNGNTMVVLMDCGKQNCLTAKSKMEEIIKKYLAGQEMEGILNPVIGWATYPDDSTDAAELITKAKAGMDIPKKS